MDFAYTEEQLLLKETVRDFAEKHFRDGVIDREEKAEFDLEGWKKLAEFGIFKLPIPEAYGGLGKDAFSCLIAMEALGYGCRDSGLLFAAGSHMWTCEIPILTFGTDEQKAKYLSDLSCGSAIGGHVMTVPDSGSDAISIRTKAVRKGDAYFLNGTKTFISNAPIADMLVVFACTDKAKGFAGISAFIVEKGFPGYSVGKPLCCWSRSSPSPPTPGRGRARASPRPRRRRRAAGCSGTCWRGPARAIPGWRPGVSARKWSWRW